MQRVQVILRARTRTCLLFGLYFGLPSLRNMPVKHPLTVCQPPGGAGQIFFINIALGERRGEPIDVHRTDIASMSMSPLLDGGVTVASCARGDSVVKITGLDLCSVLHELVPSTSSQGRAAPVYVVKYDPSGKLLATGDAEGLVRLWSPSNGAQLAVLRGHTSAVLALEFPRVSAQDGRPISRVGAKTPMATSAASSSADSVIRLWHFAEYASVPPPANPAQSAQEEPKHAEEEEEEASAAATAARAQGGPAGAGRPVPELKMVKTAVRAALFVGAMSSKADLHRPQEWECSAVLARESLARQQIRAQVMRLCLDLGIAIDVPPPPLRRTLEEAGAFEEEDVDDGDVDGDDGGGDSGGGEGGGDFSRVKSDSTRDGLSVEADRAVKYKALLKLAEQMERIGLVDPADEIAEAQAARTERWEQRQREEAMALARMSEEQRRRAERNRKPRTGPPTAPITVEDSQARRRAAVALLVRRMEETEVRDEPSSLNALRRLLHSTDEYVRTVAAVGLGFLTSRVVDLSDAAHYGDEELDEAKTVVEEEVHEHQEVLAAIGDELEVCEGEHAKAKRAYHKAVRDAAKDRKGGKDKKMKLDRQNLLETSAYRSQRAALLVRYTEALELVMAASVTLVPLQSAQVQRELVRTLLEDVSPRVHEAVLYSLAHVAPASQEPTAVAVAERIGSNDAAVRAAAALCLGEVGVGVGAAVDILLRLLDGQALHSLSVTSDQKRSALDALARILQPSFTARTRLRQSTMEALENLQVPLPPLPLPSPLSSPRLLSSPRPTL